MKILVIRFSSIGDIVLTTPVVRCLKEQIPDAHVHFLTKPRFSNIVEPNPHIEKVHLLSDDWNSMIAMLKNENFDFVVDLHNNLRSRRVSRQLKVKTRRVQKRNVQKWLLTNFKINMLPKVHIVDRYMETVVGLNVRNDYRGLDYFIPEKDIVKAADLAFAHIFGYVAMAIGGTYTTKRLPVHKLIALARQITLPIVLIGGPEDAQTGDLIANAIGPRCFNACGKYNMAQSASIIKEAFKVITHDTGMMHIAAAFKKEIHSIWGNTVPAFGMSPYLPQNPELDHIYQVNNLNCRPCSKLGFNKCPRKHFKCMELQDTNAIAQKINGV